MHVCMYVCIYIYKHTYTTQYVARARARARIYHAFFIFLYLLFIFPFSSIFLPFDTTIHIFSIIIPTPFRSRRKNIYIIFLFFFIQFSTPRHVCV